MSSLRKMQLPSWAMHVVAGANLRFDAEVHVVHASSPAHAEEEVHLSLSTGRRVGDAAAIAAPLEAPLSLQGLDVRRVQVRSRYHLLGCVAHGQQREVPW